jgi:hypothetical protein
MDDITQKLSQAYLQVLGFGKEKQEAVTDEEVIVEEELDEASVKPFMGYHQVIHNGKAVASYAAKYMAQDHARHINDEERRARQERKAQQAHKKAQQMKNKNESFELDEASVKPLMGKYQVIHNGKAVATYVAKYMAQDHANQINDEERRNRNVKSKNESFELDEALDEANFAATMKKAIAAHERGDHKRAKYHLDNAKTARYAMKSTEISKNKEMLDKYEKLRDMHEEVDQIDELSKSTLQSYQDKAKKTPAKNSWTSRVVGAGRAAEKLKKKEANTSHRHHVVSKLDGNVLASYKTKQDAHKNAYGNPVVSGSLETIGDKQYVKEQRAEKRLAGVSKAVDRLTKEDIDQFTDEEIIEFMLTDEFEQLDEISQGLLRRYHGAAASDLQKRRQKLAHGTMTTQDHKAGQRRVAGLNRAANKMEATENEIKYGRHAGMLIDRVQEAKDPKAGATPPQTYGDNASQNTKDFVDMHKAEVLHDAEKVNLQNFKNFTAKVKVAKKRPNDNSAGDAKVVK